MDLTGIGPSMEVRYRVLVLAPLRSVELALFAYVSPLPSDMEPIGIDILALPLDVNSIAPPLEAGLMACLPYPGVMASLFSKDSGMLMEWTPLKGWARVP